VAQTLVSAAPRLVSARLTDNFRQLTPENFPSCRHFTVGTSHAAGCPTLPVRRVAVSHLAFARQPSSRPVIHRLVASAGKAFIWMDRHLDCASTGPFFVRQPTVARLVVDSLYRGVALGHYDLGAFVVMANPVHILLLPKISPSRLLQSMKGFTARQANLILNRTGKPFWQAESYDHWVRDEPEYFRIAAYIENNPVKAGLVERAEDFSWSSANANDRRPKSASTRVSRRQTRVSAPPRRSTHFP